MLLYLDVQNIVIEICLLEQDPYIILHIDSNMKGGPHHQATITIQEMTVLVNAFTFFTLIGITIQDILTVHLDLTLA